MLRRISIGLAALLAITGCMSNDTIDDVDVNQDKLYGHYCGIYDANDNSLNFMAQLRVGGNTGTTVRLTEGEFAIDESVMSERYGDEAFFNLHGTYYYLRSSVDEPKESYDIIWHRSDGQTFVNTLQLPGSVRIVSPAPDSVVPVGPIAVEFTGAQLSGSETVEVVLSGHRARHHHPHDDHHHGRVRIRKRVTAGGQVVFSEDEIERIETGTNVTLELRIKSTSRPSNGHSAEGGKIESEYIAKRVRFTLE